MGLVCNGVPIPGSKGFGWKMTENFVFCVDHADKFDVFAAAITQEYTCPTPFPEKTDIEVRAVATSSNADLRVAAGLDIIYIENTAP